METLIPDWWPFRKWAKMCLWLLGMHSRKGHMNFQIGGRSSKLVAFFLECAKGGCRCNIAHPAYVALSAIVAALKSFASGWNFFLAGWSLSLAGWSLFLAGWSCKV